METENRNGLELRIHALENGVHKVEVTNWTDTFGLTYYTDNGSKILTTNFIPGVVNDNAYRYGTAGRYNRIGTAFPQDEKEMERVVHPLVAISTNWDEFGGVSLDGHEKIVEWTNYFLGQITKDFRCDSDKEAIDRALEAGYLRTEKIEDQKVYFPTEKAVRSMCNRRSEDFIAVIASYTGLNLGIGHRRDLRRVRLYR
jgi:hypothetical protein